MTALTSGSTVAQERPAASADGTIVVSDEFDTATNQDLGLQLRTLGKEQKPAALTPVGDAAGTSGATEATISPDGRSVAFVQVVDWDDPAKGAGLFVLDVAEGVTRRLTDDSFGAGYPRFSPLGDKVLFSAGLHGGSKDGLWTIPLAGGEPHRLRDGFEGDWSPDGTQIVFKVYMPGWEHNELHVADADGNDEQVLWVGDGTTAETPDWAP